MKICDKFFRRTSFVLSDIDTNVKKSDDCLEKLRVEFEVIECEIHGVFRVEDGYNTRNA